MDFFGNDIEYPYRLFEINKHFTLPELKAQYKKMVLRYHPDKNAHQVQTTEEFKILTICYKYLLDLYYKKKTATVNHASTSSYSYNAPQMGELKQKYEKETENFIPDKFIPDNLDQKFNLKRFNDVFDKHKFSDPISSKGYDHFINDNSTLDKEVCKKYGNALDEMDEMIENIGPEPIDGVDLSDCYELGGNYKNLGRTNPHIPSKLHFMDYKLAHTTAKIVDENKVTPRTEYKTLDDIKAERLRPLVPNYEEQMRLEIEKEQTKQREAERLIRLQHHEKQLQEYHERTKRLLV
jgi:curved DNA-binding protein CbpA